MWTILPLPEIFLHRLKKGLRLQKCLTHLNIVLYFFLTLVILSELTRSSEAGVLSTKLNNDAFRQQRSASDTNTKGSSEGISSIAAAPLSNLNSNSAGNINVNSTTATKALVPHQSSVTLIEPRGKAPEPDPPSANKEVSSVPEDKTGATVTGTGKKGDLGSESTSAPAFDEKAIQRSFLVLAGLGTILLAYFGIKFACVKKRKTGVTGNSSRYGLVESSEMDLLENIEEDDEDEEENDTLFDLHSHRRT